MAPYTLTGASDWPMLIGMLKTLAWVLGGLLTIILALVSASWANLRNLFLTHKADESTKCMGCNDSTIRELDAVWDTLEVCCPRAVTRPIRTRRKTDKHEKK